MIKKMILAIFTVVFSTSVLAAEGLISVESPYSVKITADRFEDILQKKGLTLFARINHSENASTVNMKLDPTEVILFGNPKVGTPLMQNAKTVAIDLPQKALFWQDANGKVWLSYNNPEYLKERHHITGSEPVINTISGVLDSLSKAATAQ